MKCQKCGGKVDPKGRYCMECFEPVRSSLSVEEERKPLPKRAIIAGVGMLVLIVIVCVGLGMRTLPPEEVALEWLEACTNQNALRAVRYTTGEFESSGFDRKMSYEKIDEYSTDRRETGLTFTPQPAKYDKPKHPTTAEVRVTFHYGKELDYDRYIILRKVGRDWKVDQMK